MEEHVILVDENDIVQGTMGKIKAHELGLLHRAFSVFIFNSKGDLLMQKRADDKYHSGGLWTNTCCSHPRENETTDQAAARRLEEEMGMQCHLTHRFSFTYKATLDNDLIEHEYDHVYFGISDDTPSPDIKEVSAWKYMGRDFLAMDLRVTPERYTEWFKLCFNKVYKETLTLMS